MCIRDSDKPSYACLATRIPAGRRIEPEALRRIDEAEARLRALGSVSYTHLDVYKRQLHARDGDDAARRHDVLRVVEQAVYARDAYVVEPLHAVATRLGGERRLLLSLIHI